MNGAEGRHLSRSGSRVGFDPDELAAVKYARAKEV